MDKKIIAAISAVVNYISMEEISGVKTIDSNDICDQKVKQNFQEQINFWSVLGRNAQMQLRNMVQIKSFRR